jgi:tetratricopeptide (TPR) repeat protein
MKERLFFLLFPLIGFSQTAIDEVPHLFEKKQFAKVENIMEIYVSENPNDTKSIELLGDTYGHQKKWDQAIEQYKKLTQINSKNAEYQYKYGGAMAMKALEVNKLSALGIIDDAEDAFLLAASLDRGHIETRWALVELYMQLPGIIGGSMSKSLKYAEELEQISQVDGLLAKGYIYEYDDEPELAEFYYKKAIEIGGSLTCYNKLTAFYENQKQPEKVIKSVEDTQEKFQRNALHYQIGKVAAEYDIHLEKGKKCLEIYIANYSPKDGVPIAWANYRLAQIYRHENKKEKALKYINLAIDELPNIKPFKKEKETILNF